MKRLLLIAFLALAPLASAQQLVDTGRGLLFASASSVKLIAANGATTWSSEGIRNVGFAAAGRSRAVVLDPLRDEAVVLDLRTGRRSVHATAETPVAALFEGDDLFVLSRDGAKVEKFAADGSKAFVATGSAPAFIRRAGDSLIVYSRVDGLLQVIDPVTMRERRRANVAPFASDMEVDASTVYLLFPRGAKLGQYDLATLTHEGDVAVGAVPVDAAFSSRANAVSAITVAVADPAARRVWTIEGRQSLAQAVGRGFLRGLIGLGLYRSGGREFPTGVDRVLAGNGMTVAYDTSTGTLYRVTGRKVVKLATAVPPGAYTLTDDGVAWLEGTTIRAAAR